MKKLLTLVIAVILGIGTMFANPVDVETAKSLGQMFVMANFEQTRTANLDLYYTVTSDNGQPCAYVFNLGNEGFVIVAASDNVRPILGYSKNGAFDASNPYNGAMYMLETYKNSISYAIEKNITATPDVVGEWTSLRNCGKLNSKKQGSVGPLVQTKWNQNSPYNLYAPAASGGPGGRCYAGCVATAMSQVMKYWDHPANGIGSHSYNCPGYGQQSANFGATTYHWELMPKSLGSASQDQIEAVATLMYHCGVAVNMGFAPDGSGAYSDDVPAAMAQYFDYNHCVKKNRNQYSLANWVALLKAEFDLGRPVYYSGHSNEGGHAFVADGYDENDLIHFNFGWSGSDDDFYAVDAIDYHTNAGAIFNYVPTAVYQNTVQAPTNVTATKDNDMAQRATISWTNPTKYMNNQNVTSLEKIAVSRNGKIIYVVDNPTPGAAMSFIDENVPCYSTFEYKVFAVQNGVNGVAGVDTESFGPTCEWKIITTTTNMNGWKGGYVMACDGAGAEIDRFTMTNNNPVTYNANMTIGRVFFVWKNGTDNVALTIKIKDAEGNVVYQYDGNSNDLTEGVIFQGNNGCGNNAPTTTAGEVFVANDGDNIIVTWNGSAKDNYGFNVYRDGLLCELAHSNEFIDEAPGIGGHCYQVCVLGNGGESVFTNEVCETAGEGCNAPRDEWFYKQDNGKPIITWSHPSNTEGLTAYFVYRKTNEDGTYERMKIVAADKTEYKETKSLEYGNWYYYRVVAYYQDIECYSAPAKAKYGNTNDVKIYYSPDGIDETAAQGVEVYPNPVKDVLTVKADNISNVVIYNSIGQKVFEQTLEADEVTISTNGFKTGVYMVRIVADGNEITKKISVIK